MFLKGYKINRLGLQTYKNFNEEDPETNEIDYCKRWLKQRMVPTDCRFPEYSYSYSLKHKVQEDCKTYISNGALICAALELGYQLKPEGEENQNCYFNMEWEHYPCEKERGKGKFKKNSPIDEHFKMGDEEILNVRNLAYVFNMDQKELDDRILNAFNDTPLEELNYFQFNCLINDLIEHSKFHKNKDRPLDCHQLLEKFEKQGIIQDVWKRE